MKQKPNSSFNKKFEGSKPIRTISIIKYGALIIGLLIIIIEIYAYFMQGDDPITGYPLSHFQFSENQLYLGSFIFFAGVFLWLKDEGTRITKSLKTE